MCLSCGKGGGGFVTVGVNSGHLFTSNIWIGASTFDKLKTWTFGTKKAV